MINGKSNLTFEDAVEQLENIIKKLEDGNLSLDESLDYFQKGIELYKYCNNLINQAEGKIKAVFKNEEGELEEKDFIID